MVIFSFNYFCLLAMVCLIVLTNHSQLLPMFNLDSTASQFIIKAYERRLLPYLTKLLTDKVHRHCSFLISLEVISPAFHFISVL